MTNESSSRVLNLIRAHQRAEQSGAPLSPALFRSAALNRCFIIKHRLRPEERDAFDDERSLATKIIFPIDPANLALGGKFVFIDQRSFEPMLADAVDIRGAAGARDVQMLRELDRIPSFDPFVLSEWMTRIGRVLDPRYFDLMPSLISGMEGFVLEEINTLVSMSLSGAADNKAVLRLARKMLSSHYDEDLTPLQTTLRMSREEFQDGMFGWKGLLYYKWLARRIAADLPPLVTGLTTIRPRTQISGEQSDAAAALVRAIHAAIGGYHKTVQRHIADYDRSYGRLTRQQDPAGFREFLMRAPRLFIEMGEQVSMLEHTTGFWAFRHRDINPRRFTGEEYLELLTDLHEGLGVGAVSVVSHY